MATDRKIGLGFNDKRFFICPLCKHPVKPEDVEDEHDIDFYDQFESGLYDEIQIPIKCPNCGRKYVCSIEADILFVTHAEISEKQHQRLLRMKR